MSSAMSEPLEQTVTHTLVTDEYSVYTSGGGETVYVTVIVHESVPAGEWTYQVRCYGAKRKVEGGYSSRDAARLAGRRWVESYDWRGVS